MAKSFRIDKQALIDEIRRRREEATARFEADSKSFPTDVEKWQAEATKKLERILADVAKGKRVGRYRRIEVDIPNRPEQPRRADYVGNFDATLAYLGKVAQDSLHLDQAEYERMVGGIR